MMKNLLSGLKYSEFRNPHSPLGYSAFRNPHSAIGNKGFTLIEIIVMIVMAGILLPVIVVPFVTGIRGSGKPEMVTTAMYLGHQRMEELMKFDYGRAPELNPTDLAACPNAPPTGYQWQYEIYYVDNNFNVVGDGKLATNNRGYKRIRVLVTDPDSTTYNVYSVVTDFPDWR
jgi:type II secretory pathway pseudopilin PulG